MSKQNKYSSRYVLFFWLGVLGGIAMGILPGAHKLWFLVPTLISASLDIFVFED